MIVLKVRFPCSDFQEAPESDVSSRQAIWTTPPMWGLGSALCKMSIVWQYRRVFPVPIMTRTCVVLLVLITVFGIEAFFGALFMCVPVEVSWGAAQGVCINKAVFLFFNSAVNILLDTIIFALPVPMVRRLQIPKIQKLALLFVFTFGAMYVCFIPHFPTCADSLLSGSSSYLLFGLLHCKNTLAQSIFLVGLPVGC
jgi:hypothetical protein